MLEIYQVYANLAEKKLRELDTKSIENEEGLSKDEINHLEALKKVVTCFYKDLKPALEKSEDHIKVSLITFQFNVYCGRAKMEPFIGE